MNQKIMIFDIDGTLACCKHRLSHILEKEPKDWDTFDSLTHLDTPIYNVIKILWLTASNPFIRVVLLTGRNERTREATVAWLNNNDVHFDILEMRNLEDHRPAAKIKLERLDDLGYTPDQVISIFEDEPNTVKELRAAGYHVCDVGGWEDGYAEALHTGGRT